MVIFKKVKLPALALVAGMLALSGGAMVTFSGDVEAGSDRRGIAVFGRTHHPSHRWHDRHGWRTVLDSPGKVCYVPVEPGVPLPSFLDARSNHPYFHCHHGSRSQ